MAECLTYTVTRRPGAPAFRAGRKWEEGQSVTLELSTADARLIATDPGYRIEAVAAAEAPSAQRPAPGKKAPRPSSLGPRP